MTWESLRLKRLFVSSTGGSWGCDAEDGDVVLPCVRGTDFDYGNLRVDLSRAPMRGFTLADVAYRAAARGDLLIEKSGGGEQQPVGRAVLYDGFDLVMPTNFAGRLRPSLLAEPRFASYLLASLYTDGRTRAAIKQTTGLQNLDLESLLSNVVMAPSTEEQRAIADFLDRETSHIDALLDQKRRLSAALMERVATLIDDAVWGDPGSRRPTFSSVVRLAQGQVDPLQRPFSEMPLVAPNHIESGTGRLAGVESASEQGAISGKYLCEEGDVIYSKIRPALAKATIAPWRCLTSADMYPLRPVDGLLPEFLLLILLSRQFTDWAVMESDRVAMPKINRDALGRLRIPLPSEARQKEVVSQIGSHQARATELRSALGGQIELLVERRQALVTAAVTGQFDIPGVAA